MSKWFSVTEEYKRHVFLYESLDADVFTGVIHVFFKPDILVSAFNQSA